MLQTYRIGTRLVGGLTGILLAIGATLFAMVVVALDSQRRTLEVVNQVDDRLGSVSAMTVAQLEAAVSVRNAATMSNSRAVKAELQSYRDALARLQAEENSLGRRDLDPASRTLLASALDLRRKSEPIVEEAMNLVLALAGDDGARVLREKLAPVQLQWSDKLKALAAHERKVGAEEVAAARQAGLSKLAWLTAALTCVVCGGVALAVVLARSVTRPLLSATDVVNRVAQGDLTAEASVAGNDEAAVMLRAIRNMAGRLSSIVLAVRESSESISTTAERISAGNNNLSRRTQSQEAAVQRTSAALRALISDVTLNKQHADAARSVAERAASSAEEGQTRMAEVTGAMAEITASSQRIADIVGAIDGIAFQTNLLALNAAVEAAGAGERGRGFAVVANEVRALAQRAAAAATEVRELIADSVQRVHVGSEQISSLGATMRGLVHCSREVRVLLDEIAIASGSQARSIDSVTGAVQELDGITGQNATLVEEVSVSSQSLVQQTRLMAGLVGQFKVIDQGDRPQPIGIGDERTDHHAE